MVLVASHKLGGIKLRLPLPKLDINPSYSFSNPQLQLQVHEHGAELSEFEKICVLGRGNYGVVHKVISRKTSSIYALRTIQDDSSISQEVQILKRTNSSYLVKCYDVFGEKAILMEYMEQGSLDNVVRNIGPLPETLISNVAKQVLNGLNYLHQNNIVHLDIKPSNLLVNNKMEVKIGDFGVSKIVDGTNYDNSSSCQVGTYAYMSPERLDSQTFGTSNVYAGDVWSLGVSLWELYVGRFPFFPAESKPPSWMEIVLVVCCGEFPSFPKQASDDFVSFLKCCLERETSKRWTASELLKHPFVCN